MKPPIIRGDLIYDNYTKPRDSFQSPRGGKRIQTMLWRYASGRTNKRGILFTAVHTPHPH